MAQDLETTLFLLSDLAHNKHYVLQYPQVVDMYFVYLNEYFGENYKKYQR